MCVDTYEDLKLSVSTTEREPESVPETTQHPKHNPNNNKVEVIQSPPTSRAKCDTSEKGQKYAKNRLK